MWLRLQRFCNIVMDLELTIFYSCLKNWSHNYQVHLGTLSVEHLFLSHCWLRLWMSSHCPLLLAGKCFELTSSLAAPQLDFGIAICVSVIFITRKSSFIKSFLNNKMMCLFQGKKYCDWNGETWLISIYKVSQSSNEEEFCLNVNMVATWDQGVWCGGFIQGV